MTLDEFCKQLQDRLQRFAEDTRRLMADNPGRFEDNSLREWAQEFDNWDAWERFSNR